MHFLKLQTKWLAVTVTLGWILLCSALGTFSTCKAGSVVHLCMSLSLCMLRKKAAMRDCVTSLLWLSRTSCCRSGYVVCTVK